MFARLVAVLFVGASSTRASDSAAGSAPAHPPSLPPITQANTEPTTHVGDPFGTPASGGEVLINEAQDAALEGCDDDEPDQPITTEALLHGLAVSDAVAAILDDSTESLTLFSSDVIVDFETEASLIVESYRSDLAGIVQRTLRQRRRRRRAANGNPAAPVRFAIPDGASHEARFSPAVLSELSRAAGDIAAEVERRQRDQKRRVRRRAILLAPLIFVDRPNRYKLPFLSTAALTARFEAPTRFFLEPSSLPAVRQSDPNKPPRRRKRSHRGFETFSQVESKR